MSTPTHHTEESHATSQPAVLARFLRLLGLRIRNNEISCALLFFLHALLLLTCYYVLKTLREPLLLADSSPELKSYAYAVAALVLLVLVPAYSGAFKRLSKKRIDFSVTAFFLANLVVFLVLGQAGIDIGFFYYAWVGVFGVTIVAQFWAYASDCFDVHSGQRLFPAIMAAAALGALIGPALVGTYFTVLGPWVLMLVAGGLLALTLPLIELCRKAIPAHCRSPRNDLETPVRKPLGGFGLVVRDRYLLLLAILMVLLNCVNTTGEYLLADLVVRFAADHVARNPALDQGAIIAAFYGSYYTTINLLTVIGQLFLVSRLVRWIGVHGALLILPIVAFIGYGLVIFVPVFAVLNVVKTLENAVDYSVMNTSRQALYLPLCDAHKYQGKMAIDTFFYRFGDLVQAAIVFAGLNVIGFEFHHFAILNACLVLAWFVVATKLAKLYGARSTDTAGPAAIERLGARFTELLGDVREHVPALHRRLVLPVLTCMAGVLALTTPAPTETRVLLTHRSRHERAAMEEIHDSAVGVALTPSVCDSGDVSSGGED